MSVAFLFADYQSALRAAGPFAERLQWLWWFFFAICTAVYVIVIAFAIDAMRRGAKRSEPIAINPRTDRVVGGAIGLTAALLVVLLAASVAVGRAVSPHDDRGEHEIRVTGHQWWWEVQYDSPRADEIVQTANELHLPVGERVRLILTSRDVIHSLWIPNLHGKRDLIPGQDAVLTIQADKPGIYRAQCAEFCGFQHAKMAFVVIVEPKEQFHRWLANERLPARHPKTADEQHGQQVFLNTTCAMCHAIKGTPAGARTGPDLTHIGSRRSLGAGTLPNRRGHLQGWIANAQSTKPGVLMPPNNLEPDDLNALVAYLESLK